MGSAASITYTGTVLAAARVRFAVIDAQGHHAPTLCMALRLDEPAGAVLHVEQPFDPNAVNACRMAAMRYRAGQRLSVTTPTGALIISARLVNHINKSDHPTISSGAIHHANSHHQAV